MAFAGQGPLYGACPSPPSPAVVTPAMDLSADIPTAVDPPAPLLPLLTLAEAHEVLDVLAAVASGGRPDREAADRLLSNLAARVPSRDPA